MKSSSSGEKQGKHYCRRETRPARKGLERYTLDTQGNYHCCFLFGWVAVLFHTIRRGIYRKYPPIQMLKQPYDLYSFPHDFRAVSI